MTNPYRPSNGTEGDIFTSNWCAICTKDLAANGTKIIDNCSDDELCDILGVSYIFDINEESYPAEWVEDENGARCTVYISMQNKEKH